MPTKQQRTRANFSVSEPYNRQWRYRDDRGNDNNESSARESLDSVDESALESPDTSHPRSISTISRVISHATATVTGILGRSRSLSYQSRSKTIKQFKAPKAPRSDSSDEYGFKETPEGFENINIGGEPTLAKEDMLYREARFKPPGRVEQIYQTGRVIGERVNEKLRSTSMLNINEKFQTSSSAVQAVTTNEYAYGVIRSVASGDILAMGQAVILTANAFINRDSLDRRHQQAGDKVRRVVKRKDARDNQRMNQLLDESLEAISSQQGGEKEIEDHSDHENEWEVWDIEEDEDSSDKKDNK